MSDSLRPLGAPPAHQEDRADCRECKGQGSFWEDVCGDGGPRMQVECDACLGTGKELSRNELANLSGDDE